jgi:hypothetical protein
MRKTGADNRIKLSVSAVSRSLLAEASGKRHAANQPRRIITK